MANIGPGTSISQHPLNSETVHSHAHLRIILAAVASGQEGFSITFAPVSQRGSIVNYICDPSAGVGQFKWITIPPSGGTTMMWTFEWRTQYACPTGGGGGGGGGGGSASSGGGISGGWIFVIWCVRPSSSSLLDAYRMCVTR
jgi:hypothetical protein